jgi:AraC family transcriptional regulator
MVGVLENESARRAASHFGTTLSATRIGAFTLTEARYRPGLRTGWHWHTSAAFCLVLSGRYVERFRGIALDCVTSTMVFRPAGIEHFDEIDPQGAACFFVEPTPSWEPAVCDRELVKGDVRVIIGVRARWLLAQARHEMRYPDTATPLALDGIIHMLLAECARSTHPWPSACAPWLRRARDVLNDRFVDPPTLAELSTEVGVHPTYLATEFRRAFRTTVGELRAESSR